VESKLKAINFIWTIKVILSIKGIHWKGDPRRAASALCSGFGCNKDVASVWGNANAAHPW
jgi:hypothetical protein